MKPETYAESLVATAIAIIIIILILAIYRYSYSYIEFIANRSLVKLEN